VFRGLGGLSLGNNILILFQKEHVHFMFYFYPKFLARGGHARVMRAGGMHAVPWVTSVRPWRMCIK
jgi:hypothetical protein